MKTSNSVSQTRQAMIAGSTGLVGSFLLKALLSSPVYGSVQALVRRPLDIRDSKLETKIVDFANLSFEGAEGDLAANELSDESEAPFTTASATATIPKPHAIDLFCALGTTIKKAGSQQAFRAVDFDAVLKFARWGHAQGAQRFFLVSAMGADPKSAFFYNRVKGETERALASVGFEELHLFRPSLLLGPRGEFRLGERVGEVLSRPLGGLFKGRLEKYRPIQAKDVAEGMLQAAIAPSQLRASLEAKSKADQGKTKTYIYESNVIMEFAALPVG